MHKNRSTEEIHIDNLSKKRYVLLGNDYPNWDYEKEDTLHPPEVEKEIDDLAKQILDCIKNWRKSLPFEFIFEELTKLGWAPCLLYDDNGNFAISGDGMQSVPMDPIQEKGTDWISHWVKEDGWFPTIREALNDYLYDDEQED